MPQQDARSYSVWALNPGQLVDGDNLGGLETSVSAEEPPPEAPPMAPSPSPRAARQMSRSLTSEILDSAVSRASLGDGITASKQEPPPAADEPAINTAHVVPPARPVRRRSSGALDMAKRFEQNQTAASPAPVEAPTRPEGAKGAFAQRFESTASAASEPTEESSKSTGNLPASVPALSADDGSLAEVDTSLAPTSEADKALIA